MFDEIIEIIGEIDKIITKLEALKVDLQKLQEKPETPPTADADADADADGEQLYVEYRNGVPYKYAYGESWVAAALWIDDVGYDTPEEAKKAWKKRKR